MQHLRRALGGSALVVALVVMAGCSDDSDDTAPTTTTTTTTTTAAPTTTAAATTTTTAPTTTVAEGTTTTTTTTVAVTPTSEPADTEAPPAPTNVTCGVGAGSGEITLEWDAPADPADIADVRIYIDEGAGFTRLHKYTIDSGQVRTDTDRWWAVAWPVPSGEVVQMAVTVGDAAGNESGWNPIGAFYEFAAGPCTTS
ncbi:MAG: hypothetical protein R8F63_14155 [Acidimicrobiales bacterium]|nr:hypothetical protein [Acidimicrobiales bacterium]